MVFEVFGHYQQPALHKVDIKEANSNQTPTNTVNACAYVIILFVYAKMVLH